MISNGNEGANDATQDNEDNKVYERTYIGGSGTPIDWLELGASEQQVLQNLEQLQQQVANSDSSSQDTKERLVTAAQNCRENYGSRVWTKRVATQFGLTLKSVYAQSPDLELQVNVGDLTEGDFPNDGLLESTRQDEKPVQDFVKELAYEIYLRDKHQYRVNMQGIVSSTLGWCCLFALCHAPWIISALYLLQVEENPECREGQLSAYLWGFVIILCIVVCINLCLSVCRSCEGETVWGLRREHARLVAGFNALAVITYNIWGLLLIWAPAEGDTLNGNSTESYSETQGWRTGTSAVVCPSLHTLATGTVVTFGILPACFGVFQRLTISPKMKYKN